MHEMTACADHQIRTRPCPDCYICGTKGVLLYQGLEDRLFNAPGVWDLKSCTNAECGLVWLDPMPLEEEIRKAYQSYYTHGSEKREQSLLSSARQVRLVRLGLLRPLFKFLKHGYLASVYGYTEGTGGLQRIAGYALYFCPFLVRSLAKGVRYVRYRPNGRLLDVGCGDGAYLHYMQGLGWKAEGVEVDPLAVEQAHRLGLLIHYGTLEQQGFEGGRFDVITLNHVLEHVHDPLGLLKECQRLLKPEGVIKVLVPNVESAGHRGFGADWRGLEPPRHIYIFSIRALKELVTKAGFDVNVKTSTQGARSIYLRSAALASQNNTRSNVTNPLLIALKAYLFNLYESFAVLSGREQGEEIVLQGRKA